MSEKPTISASRAIEDIRTGLSDAEIMDKYGLSPKGLQSLITKLVAMNLLTQADLDNRNHNSPKNHQSQISIKELLSDIRLGMSYLDLMTKYDLSYHKLDDIFKNLIKANFIGQEDFDRCQDPINAQGTIDLSTDSASVKGPKRPSEVTPTQPSTKWFTCPSCGLPQNYEFKICPQCGVILEKYMEGDRPEPKKKQKASSAPRRVRFENIVLGLGIAFFGGVLFLWIGDKMFDNSVPTNKPVASKPVASKSATLPFIDNPYVIPLTFEGKKVYINSFCGTLRKSAWGNYYMYIPDGGDGPVEVWLVDPIEFHGSHGLGNPGVAPCIFYFTATYKGLEGSTRVFTNARPVDPR